MGAKARQLDALLHENVALKDKNERLRNQYAAMRSLADVRGVEIERLRTVIDEFFCGNVPHGLQEALEGSE